MKITIITVYHSLNYGSFLQAYALSGFFKALGHEVNFLKWDTGSRPAWSSVMKSIMFRRTVSIRGIRAGIGRIRCFQKQRSCFAETDSLDGTDLAVVGSDTLWDVARKQFRNTILYGDMKSGIRCIAYAVSCSDSTERDFRRYSDITDYLSGFAYLSVRDMHTRAVLKKSKGLEAELVCDPTLLVNEKIWKLHSIQKDLSDVILVYAYELPQNIIVNVKRFAKEKNCRLVSLCMYQPWCDGHLNCLPLDFASYLKAARYVVTNTFHGSIFCIIAECGWIAVKNGYKLDCLLRDYFEEDFSLGADSSYEELAAYPVCRIDYKSAKYKIRQARQEACARISDVLNSL